MKQSKEDLRILLDNNIYENVDQDILGSMANEVLINFVDSLAPIDNPVFPFSFRIHDDDLDGSSSKTFEHELDSAVLKIVMYDHLSRRIYREYYDFEIVDSAHFKITVLQGIPFNKLWKGYIYKIA